MVSGIQNWERDYVFNEEAAGRALVLCPDVALDISRTEHDPVKIYAAYLEGRRIAEERLGEIKAFLR